ncbi:DUF5133 domain-containing protein [Streptomyces sp. NPDC048361]|uniref:DUF5133 domain-containing protein n=1 Tax=Streptomyces sp. NPDC048361 TaxID=3154720 RepID=UPI0034495AB4
MLMAHPAVLRNLMDQYDVLRILHAEHGTAEVRRRMDDTIYTLCVLTGTRDIDAALHTARHQLCGVRPHDDALVPA